MLGSDSESFVDRIRREKPLSALALSTGVSILLAVGFYLLGIESHVLLWTIFGATLVIGGWLSLVGKLRRIVSSRPLWMFVVAILIFEVGVWIGNGGLRSFLPKSDGELVEIDEEKFWCGKAAEALGGRLSIAWSGCDFRGGGRTEIAILVEDVVADKQIGDRLLGAGETLPIHVDGTDYIVKLVEMPANSTDTGVVKVYRGKQK